ncbi:MAG: ABC transporter ATP-binding protein/permease, partial [Clostridiales Family XIII bacterium]|nr:ABC transporter ATP-binding protein/permease [Clostridiales Family XIII bacterium]
MPNNKKNMQRKKTGKTGMSRLWELTFTKKLLIILSIVLAVISAAFSLVPFIVIYYIIRELTLCWQDLSLLNTSYMINLGLFAAGGAVISVLLNFIALMCSHWAAFSTLYLLRLDFTRHIAALPLGFHTKNSTGKLRKIVDINIEKLELFIADQLPDIAASFAMPIFMLVILFTFDFRLGIATLIPILLIYLIQFFAYGGKKAKFFIKKYQDSLDEMNNAAVEYVRGISVVKAFNQTIFSFRKFYETIKHYGKFVKNYTMSFETPMVFFMLIIGHVYLFIIPAIILLSQHVNNYAEFAFSSVFYLIFSLSLAATFTKLLYVSQTSKQVADGIERMDKIFEEKPLKECSIPKTTNETDVEFENVIFSYKTETEMPALSDVNFRAEKGEITAVVGPSGSGKSTIAHLIPRFYDVKNGAVKIGGVDIRDMREDYLMSLVS